MKRATLAVLTLGAIAVGLPVRWLACVLAEAHRTLTADSCRCASCECWNEEENEC